MKKLDFSVMSDKRCSCGKKLKANVVLRKEEDSPIVCYECHCIAEEKRYHRIGPFGGPRRKRLEVGLPTK